jgi:hypothetical protein
MFIPRVDLQWFGEGEEGEGKPTTTTGGWADQLPPELRSDADVAAAAKLTDFVKGHLTMRGELTATKAKTEGAIVIPGTGEVDAQTTDSVLSRLGYPGKPEGYELPELKLPDGTPLKDLDATFRAAAVEGKLTKAQAKAAFTKIASSVIDARRSVDAAMARATEERATKLRADWGPQFGANQEKAHRVFAATAAGKPYEAELKEVLEGGGLRDHPTILRWAADMYSLIGEDTLGGGHHSAQGGERQYGLKYPGIESAKK